MKKIKLLKSISLSISLSILIIAGLNSCGSEESNDVESINETEEVIIEKDMPENDSESNEVKKESKTRVITRKKETINANSKPEKVELQSEIEAVDFGDIGFTESYNYMDVDIPPMFDECMQKISKEEQEACYENILFKNLQDNIKYPESAKKLKLKGKTYIGFVVDKSGMISQVKIVKGSGAEYETTDKPINEYINAYKDLDQAAIDAINATPKVRPAMVDNQPVNVQYVVPVIFALK